MYVGKHLREEPLAPEGLVLPVMSQDNEAFLDAKSDNSLATLNSSSSTIGMLVNLELNMAEARSDSTKKREGSGSTDSATSSLRGGSVKRTRVG